MGSGEWGIAIADYGLRIADCGKYPKVKFFLISLFAYLHSSYSWSYQIASDNRISKITRLSYEEQETHSGCRNCFCGNDRWIIAMGAIIFRCSFVCISAIRDPQSAIRNQKALGVCEAGAAGAA
jgi:hypothetical protein